MKRWKGVSYSMCKESLNTPPFARRRPAGRCLLEDKSGTGNGGTDQPNDDTCSGEWVGGALIVLR